jgi:hypothetical protein
MLSINPVMAKPLLYSSLDLLKPIITNKIIPMTPKGRVIYQLNQPTLAIIDEAIPTPFYFFCRGCIGWVITFSGCT